MNSASKLGSGFQQQAGAPILKRACKAAPQIAVGGLATAAILCVFAVAWVKYSDYQAAQLQRDIDAQHAQVEFAHSPVEQILRCKDQASLGSFGSGNAGCIEHIVKVAQTINSDHITGLVTRHISAWLDKAIRVQASKILRFSVSSSRL